MNISTRRVRAIFRKELREYRRRGSIVAGMAIIPLLFLIQPLVVVFGLRASASEQLRHEHPLLYMLGIPALVPALIAAYAVVGERQQGTLEPVLATPIRREEFLLGKALGALVPSLAISYSVFALVLACVEMFADPANPRRSAQSASGSTPRISSISSELNGSSDSLAAMMRFVVSSTSPSSSASSSDTSN